MGNIFLFNTAIRPEYCLTSSYTVEAVGGDLPSFFCDGKRGRRIYDERASTSSAASRRQTAEKWPFSPEYIIFIVANGFSFRRPDIGVSL